MVSALCRELEQRRDYLGGDKIDTIYLGGGTPSLLNASELNILFLKIEELFAVSPEAEVTLESNPDDLSHSFLTELLDTPVNRLSIGIQSFFDEDLRAMNRAHDAVQSHSCLELVHQMGFDNFNIDLIYGMPTLSMEQWQDNLLNLNTFEVPHVSCYALTVEPGTALFHQIRKGQAPDVKDDKMVAHFRALVEFAEENELLHYEISNLARPQKLAVHNRNYWFGAPYLGIGPSAHSFNGQQRSWNVANNQKYLKAIDQNLPYQESESLSEIDQYNEYVLTRLRTMWGCQINEINKWGEETYQHFHNQIQPFLDSSHVRREDSTYRLTPEGMLLADHISKELFMT